MLKMTKYKIFKFLAFILVLGLCIPERGVIPVKNATTNDWNSRTFWFSPWGKSGVHKGMDIFAKIGTPVLASTSGWVIYTGNISMGGNVIAVLGPKWRIYYYAHLAHIHTHTFDWANRGEIIGAVGSSGNAIGKPAHLHYSVLSLLPYPWRFSTETQGWKKMFFMNPSDGFEKLN